MGIDAAKRIGDEEVYRLQAGGDFSLVRRAGRMIVQTRNVDIASLDEREVERLREALGVMVKRGPGRPRKPGPSETKG